MLRGGNIDKDLDRVKRFFYLNVFKQCRLKKPTNAKSCQDIFTALEKEVA